MIFVNKIKKLFITTEEAEKRLSELEFIIKEMYPDLPNVSAEEYLVLKNKFFEGDLQARQKLELFAFKSSISSLKYIYMKYDVKYEFADALNDVYIMLNKKIQYFLQTDDISSFISYVRQFAHNEFRRLNLVSARKNLDLADELRGCKKIDADLDQLARLKPYYEIEDNLDLVFRNGILKKYLGQLRGREEKVLKMKCGFDLDRPMTAVEIGECYNVTSTYIHKVLGDGILNLKESSLLNELENIEE